MGRGRGSLAAAKRKNGGRLNVSVYIALHRQ